MGDQTPPHAPWSLTGECFIGWAWARTDAVLPLELRRVPGPTWLTAARYDHSPVGPYLELVVAEPARLGARPGMCVTTMVVDSADSRIGGRLNWGFPKELGTLAWDAEGDDRALRWAERDIVVRARPVGPAVPMFLPVRALQRRADGPVVVPGRLWGRGRLSRVEVDIPPGDPLAALAGAHRGVLVAGLHLVVNPARRPTGLTATLRAPLRAAEPALTWRRQPTHAGD